MRLREQDRSRCWRGRCRRRGRWSGSGNANPRLQLWLRHRFMCLCLLLLRLCLLHFRQLIVLSVCGGRRRAAGRAGPRQRLAHRRCCGRRWRRRWFVSDLFLLHRGRFRHRQRGQRRRRGWHRRLRTPGCAGCLSVRSLARCACSRSAVHAHLTVRCLYLHWRAKCAACGNGNGSGGGGACLRCYLHIDAAEASGWSCRLLLRSKSSRC